MIFFLCFSVMFLNYNIRMIHVIFLSNLWQPWFVLRLWIRRRLGIHNCLWLDLFGDILETRFIIFSQDPAYYLLKEDESPCIFGSIEKQRWSYACAKQLIERLIYGRDNDPYSSIFILMLKCTWINFSHLPLFYSWGCWEWSRILNSKAVQLDWSANGFHTWDRWSKRGCSQGSGML